VLVEILQLRNLEGRKAMIAVPITLEQLIQAVQQLQPEERAQVAHALLELDLRADLTTMLEELYAQPPADEVTDDAIMAEIQAVRQQPH
jgi:hypothetical protein